MTALNVSTMKERTDFADKGTEEIMPWFWSFDNTVGVRNVEKNKEYQKMDVDLLWDVLQKGAVKSIRCEVKVDKYHRTGNYFFETHSNKERGTEGCFMYTKAHLLLYYFPGIKELHIISVEKARKWFVENMDRFMEKETQTAVGNGAAYTTVGRLVKRSEFRLAMGVKDEYAIPLVGGGALKIVYFEK